MGVGWGAMARCFCSGGMRPAKFGLLPTFRRSLHAGFAAKPCPASPVCRDSALAHGKRAQSPGQKLLLTAAKLTLCATAVKPQARKSRCVRFFITCQRAGNFFV